MAIDYVIDYKCLPKKETGTDGLMAAIKGRAQAEKIIELFREQGDERPPSAMEFGLVRNTPTGEEETRTLRVQDLIDGYEDMLPLASHCESCPANHLRRPFGCIGFIEYPISRIGEAWLLDQMPNIDEPLPWLLLRQGVDEFKYDGGKVAPMRANSHNFFQERMVMSRHMGEFDITSNQIFEMLFLLGHIQPAHASVLILLFHAIKRNMDANVIMNMATAPEDVLTRFPFQIKASPKDDPTIRELKAFLLALYLAWGLNVPVLLDV